jgi:hypothetical protein
MPTTARSQPWIPGLLASVAMTLTAAACKPMAASSPDSATSQASADESITNVQEQGVDEGGIVKTHGDHLVVLRRGRLFSVHLGDDALRPISYVDVTPHPEHDAWYDEMLIHGDTIVVIGYSYRVGGTEIGLFHIDGKGELSYRDTWFLSSGDYYSSSNYASRLTGDQLVFYMPSFVGSDVAQADVPELAHWMGGDRRTRKRADWARLIEHSEIIPAITKVEDPVLHSVVTCDLGEASLGCRARGIIGGYGRSFYVSSEAIYVWTADLAPPGVAPTAALYRLPLREGPIGAAHVRGLPIDQLSFDETADGHLAVLVATDAIGDAMWSDRPPGDLGIVRVPLTMLEQRGEQVPPTAYRDLPDVGERTNGLQNRFVGDLLLYGSGNGWWNQPEKTEDTALYVHHHTDPEARTHTIALPHAIDRIEALGRDGLVVGSDGKNLHFTSLALGDRPAVASRFVQPDASQGELRSHGFFFKPSGEGDGMLGLPVRSWNAMGAEHLVHGSAGVTFLRVDDLRLSRLGELESNPQAGVRDACITSCVDWYGNARPIFYRGRVFALLGYELVEGRVIDGEVREHRRTDLTRMLGGGLRHAG